MLWHRWHRLVSGTSSTDSRQVRPSLSEHTLHVYVHVTGRGVCIWTTLRVSYSRYMYAYITAWERRGDP